MKVKNISCVLLSKEQLPGKLLKAMPAVQCAFNESNVSSMKVSFEDSYNMLFPIPRTTVSQLKKTRCGVFFFFSVVR